MPQTIDNTASYVGSATVTAHSASLTLGSGASRKVIVIAGQETGSGGYSSATFDGNTMTSIASATATHGSDASVKIAAWYYDVPDGAGTGAKTVTVTSSIGTPNLSWFAWQTTDSATGAPEYANVVSQTTASATISDASVATNNGSAILTGWLNSSASATADTWTNVDERQENNETNYTTAFADRIQNSGGTKTVSLIASSTSTNKLLSIVSVAAATASGLTITSVNTTNTAFSAQTDSAVIGTGLSASVVCTYAGIACANESASSSTSLKITFPNFFTNNIKLGRNYEFKVVG